MIKILDEKEMRQITAPNQLEDVLASLKENRLISRFSVKDGRVKLEIPKKIEVARLFEGLKGFADEPQELDEFEKAQRLGEEDNE